MQSINISLDYQSWSVLCKMTLVLNQHSLLHANMQSQSVCIKCVVMGRMTDIESFLGLDASIGFH